MEPVQFSSVQLGLSECKWVHLVRPSWQKRAMETRRCHSVVTRPRLTLKSHGGYFGIAKSSRSGGLRCHAGVRLYAGGPGRPGWNIQSLISAVESDERKLSAEMAVRFSQALGETMDELLGSGRREKKTPKPNRKVLRRPERNTTLPAHQQNAVLKSIDLMLKGLAS